ncbi:cyclin family protein [Striga asiatica]|uniref:Cyclin family protein n=1 Tax=Striga asiatica TaxID=4170 RepID=A0A5A7QNW8_STRAF|nr:cyclin family protein [Striga asiatica]
MAELQSSEVIMKVIRFLSSLLQRVAETNDVFGSYGARKISIFHGLTRPTISIKSYLERIFKYANCSPSCYVVAYIYLDRFARKQPLMPINSFNVHRLLIASVLISAKFMDDIYYNNAYYAKVGGISTAEMNLLEVDFLFGLSFELNVSTATFHHYFGYLQREILLELPPIYAVPSTPKLNLGAKDKLHFCANEEGSTAHQQQLAV